MKKLKETSYGIAKIECVDGTKSKWIDTTLDKIIALLEGSPPGVTVTWKKGCSNPARAIESISF